MIKLSRRQIHDFQSMVNEHYKQNARHMPWRNSDSNGNYSPYAVLVSEFMLQQTQVTRVESKYKEFLKCFPSINALASADLRDVLDIWSGLGYNRRAKYLHDAAKKLQSVKSHWSFEQLIDCKGIGHNTAAAVIAYAYDTPVVFVETNIRTVFIHHFFHDAIKVSDKEIYELVRQTLPIKNVRHWYYALMDYGTYLKRTIGNNNIQSSTVRKQSAFIGSKRQVRGQVLRWLRSGHKSTAELSKLINDTRLNEVLEELLDEELIHKKNHQYLLG